MNYPGSLHNHTHFSNFRLRDCIIKEEDLINKALELNHSVLAITDHETIASAVRVEKIYNKIKEKNTELKIIMGNEIYLCRDGANNENWDSSIDKYYHFLLLAKDQIGFYQICELSTRAWLRSYMSRGMRRVPTYYADIQDIIGKNPGHVIGSTACLGGMVATQLLKYKKDPSEELWNKILNWCVLMQAVFGKGNFYLELQPSATIEQTYVNRKLIEISKILNIDYIITCDSHYLTKEDREIHKAYLNAQNGDREVDAFYATTYLMDTQDLIEHLDLSEEEIQTAFNNILKIRNSCKDYSIMKPLKIPSLKWNDYSNIKITKEWIEKIPTFQTFLNSEFDGDQILVKAIIAGIDKHPDLQNKESYDEINRNLEATWISSNVNKAHWSAYYLNLQKIIDLCWLADSLVGPGRGSGVGFILLYCLGITQINPLREKTRTHAWRFLNPDRVSVLDVDFDIEGRKRTKVLNKFREYYGEDRVANVTTLRTEKSKSAILTAARGMGIDNDIAQYLASFIPSDRGQLRTLSEVYYGDKEKDYKPITPFVREMEENYPELWEVAKKIEGLICGTGIHAGGVIFVDEPFYKSTGLMRAPDGTICTQFDLHDAEAVSLIKYDALSVEAMDKIHICLDLLCDFGYVKRKSSLKETYEKVLGIYNIEREDKEMWNMVWNHKILSLFQMEKESGIKGISTLHPTSVDDLAILNSTIRLMAQEKGGEMPTEKLARFKANPQEWKKEMQRYGLGEKEYQILYPILSMSYGLCIAQEQFMELVQLPELGGFSLTWADKLRKSIAKKNPKEYDNLTKEFYQVTAEKGINQNFAHYVWDVLIAMSKGYGFNQSHTLAYSLIGLQEMNLAYKYPIIFWNCACLISDSGSAEEEDKTKGTNYEKIAVAIGKMQASGIKISPPDINYSDSGFKPDVNNNLILYGLQALTNISDEIVEKIKENRPYRTFLDFLNKCPLNKSQMISLIKAGAFDNLDINWTKKINNEPRYVIMAYYISLICEPKNKLTLLNFNGLIQERLVPNSLIYEQRTFAFNKYLKKNKYNIYYYMSLNDLDFYNDLYDNEGLEIIQNIPCIKQKTWDKIYKKIMDNAREWLKENQSEILNEYNSLLFMKMWNKYAYGTISSWEMESMCYYYHDHELENINTKKYGITNFNILSPNSEVDYYWKRAGRQIPIFKLSKIVGTVISKDNLKSTVTILTTTGVVTVKFTKEYFANYNKQISEVQADGTKKVIEKSWFSRGTKIMVTGYRREDTFVTKSYKSTPTHQLYKITEVNGGDIKLEHERVSSNE